MYTVTFMSTRDKRFTRQWDALIDSILVFAVQLSATLGYATPLRNSSLDPLS